MFLTLLAAASCLSNGSLPDPKCTPGTINPIVTQENIKQTICAPGYTKKIRPNVSYTNSLKRKQMKEYGFTGSPRNYEEDHFIPLETGGTPTSSLNLWPEPLHLSINGKNLGAKTKDKLENFVHKNICLGKMTLLQGQDAMLHWVDSYKKYIGDFPKYYSSSSSSGSK